MYRLYYKYIVLLDKKLLVYYIHIFYQQTLTTFLTIII